MKRMSIWLLTLVVSLVSFVCVKLQVPHLSLFLEAKAAGQDVSDPVKGGGDSGFSSPTKTSR